jgi:hypothetical protein
VFFWRAPLHQAILLGGKLQWELHFYGFTFGEFGIGFMIRRRKAPEVLDREITTTYRVAELPTPPPEIDVDLEEPVEESERRRS